MCQLASTIMIPALSEATMMLGLLHHYERSLSHQKASETSANGLLLKIHGDICDGQQPEKRKDGQGVAARPCDNWVQCDKCKKWRMLSNNTDPSDLPEKWFCWLNDTNINDCSIPEEKKPIGQASQLMSASYWSLYKKLRISWSSSDDSDDGDDTD